MKLTKKQNDWRRERLEAISRCDICQNPSEVIHEFARGTGNRPHALTEVCCQLVLCTNCHTGPKGVHDGGYSVAEQMAYLMLRRPFDMDYEKYAKIIARRWPSLADIDAAYEAIWEEINSKLFNQGE